MSLRTLAAAAMLSALGAPAIAQSGSMQGGQSNAMPAMQDGRSGHAEQIQAGPERRGPTTRQLNRRVDRYTSARARARADYQRDRRAYMAAVMRRHRQSVRRYHQRYAKREMAYANAMAAWRRQVDACHRGDRRACTAASPRVADFY